MRNNTWWSCNTPLLWKTYLFNLVAWTNFRGILGVKTCQVFLCFLAIMFLGSIMLIYLTFQWLLCSNCFTCIVSFIGFYTWYEPNFIIAKLSWLSNAWPVSRLVPSFHLIFTLPFNSFKYLPYKTILSNQSTRPQEKLTKRIANVICFSRNNRKNFETLLSLICTKVERKTKNLKLPLAIYVIMYHLLQKYLKTKEPGELV